MHSAKPFKSCSACGEGWSTREDFLDDPGISLIGYQANFVALEKGLFLFNHSCQSTLSVEMRIFSDLYAGPVFEKRLTGSEGCAGYCLHRNNLRPCPAECECAYVRQVIALLSKPIQLTDMAV